MAALTLFITPAAAPHRYISQEPLPPGRLRYWTATSLVGDDWEIAEYKEEGFFSKTWFVINKVGAGSKDPLFIGRNAEKVKILARLVLAAG